MMSVIIPTLDDERALVRTLAALVPGATSGLVSEVLIADGGSRDDCAAVADVAGCNFMAVNGSLGRRLNAAAAVARASWLLFLRPGTVLDSSWTAEARQFLEQPPAGIRAAVFRRGAATQPALPEAWSLLMAAMGRRPRPQQTLLIARQFYQQIGGHSETAADPEDDLRRRIGRRRIVTLSSRAFHAG
jgi:hypothetical protein